MTRPLVFLICWLTLISLSLAIAQTPVTSIRSYRSGHEAEILAEFSDFVDSQCRERYA